MSSKPVADAKKLVDDVYAHFRNKGRWPKVYELQRQYGPQTNVRVLAAKVGPGYIHCEQSTDPECFLTLQGLARLKQARPDLDLFAKCTGIVGKHYAASGRTPVSKAQLQAELSVDTADMNRAGVLLRRNPAAWGSAAWPEDGNFTLHPSEDAVFYAGVTTYDEYRAAEKRLEADRHELAQLERGRSLSLANLDIEAGRQRRQQQVRHRARDTAAQDAYVDQKRLGELRSIKLAKWDLSRLIRLCEELNLAYQNGALISISLLVRAIVDHVPPIFASPNFTAVANNAAGKSLTGNLQHLDLSLRNIADGLLHTQIRASETLPTATQVNFRADLDVLLAELARRLKQGPR